LLDQGLGVGRTVGLLGGLSAVAAGLAGAALLGWEPLAWGALGGLAGGLACLGRAGRRARLPAAAAPRLIPIHSDLQSLAAVPDRVPFPGAEEGGRGNQRIARAA
jgi:hypothetical protein